MDEYEPEYEDDWGWDDDYAMDYEEPEYEEEDWGYDMYEPEYEEDDYYYEDPYVTSTETMTGEADYEYGWDDEYVDQGEPWQGNDLWGDNSYDYEAEDYGYGDDSYDSYEPEYEEEYYEEDPYYQPEEYSYDIDWEYGYGDYDNADGEPWQGADLWGDNAYDYEDDYGYGDDYGYEEDYDMYEEPEYEDDYDMDWGYGEDDYDMDWGYGEDDWGLYDGPMQQYSVGEAPVTQDSVHTQTWDGVSHQQQGSIAPSQADIWGWDDMDYGYGYEEPAYEEPVYEEPEPVYEEPVYEEPEPVYEEPVYEEPEPVYEEPVYEEPEPVYEEPVYEEPKYEMPKYEEPSYPHTHVYQPYKSYQSYQPTYYGYKQPAWTASYAKSYTAPVQGYGSYGGYGYGGYGGYEAPAYEAPAKLDPYNYGPSTKNINGRLLSLLKMPTWYTEKYGDIEVEMKQKEDTTCAYTETCKDTYGKDCAYGDCGYDKKACGTCGTGDCKTCEAAVSCNTWSAPVKTAQVYGRYNPWSPIKARSYAPAYGYTPYQTPSTGYGYSSWTPTYSSYGSYGSYSKPSYGYSSVSPRYSSSLGYGLY